MKILKLNDLTEKSKEWIIAGEEYKKLSLIINLVAGVAFIKYAVYKVNEDKELCVMLTNDINTAVIRYNAIEEIAILSQPPEEGEEEST